MGEITSQANEVLRDFVVPGVPASGKHKPPKLGLRTLFALVDSYLTTNPLRVFCATRAALKAVDPARFQMAYLGEGLRGGDFVWRAGNFSAAIALDTREGLYIKADSVAASAGAWVRVTDVVRPEFFGATLDGANDYPACLAAFTMAKFEIKNLWLRGHMTWDLAGGTAEWDPTVLLAGARRAIRIIGEGHLATRITLTNATNIGWYIKSTTDWFDPYLSGFTVAGSFAFPLCVIGNNDFSDPVNMLRLIDVSFENSANSPNNVALRLNYIAGGKAENLRCNAYALAVDNVLVAVNGTGIEIRQAKFMQFDAGGFGNAARSIDFKDGSSQNCVFIAPTLENCDYAVSHRSSVSGAHEIIAANMTNVREYEAQSSACLANRWIYIRNPNCAGVCRVDPANYQGISIEDDATVATPAAPASGVSVTNTTGRDVTVTYWGPSAVSVLNLQGAGDGITATSGSFHLPAGKSFSMNYTGTLTMRWRNAS